MSLDLYVWAPCVSIKVKEREENALILASAVLGWIKKKKKSKYMKKPQQTKTKLEKLSLLKQKKNQILVCSLNCMCPGLWAPRSRHRYV